MNKRGPKSNSRLRYKAEAEIIAKHGTMSARKISELLKTEYGMIVSHTTVNDDLKKDLDALSDTELKNKKTTILNGIEVLANDAYNIARTDQNNKIRLSAMDTYTKIVKTQADVLKKFEEVKMSTKHHLRPIYNIFIGKPKEADLSKIKKETKNDTEIKK